MFINFDHPQSRPCKIHSNGLDTRALLCPRRRKGSTLFAFPPRAESPCIFYKTLFDPHIPLNRFKTTSPVDVIGTSFLMFLKHERFIWQTYLRRHTL